MVDYLEKFQIKVFGPNKFSSQLEGSKIFTKELCKKYKIPTAKFGIFEDSSKAKNFINNSNFPIVVKADNLASGKGVYICYSKEEAETAIDEIFNGKFGIAKNILIEEFLKGEEMSFFTIHDGVSFKTFETAQDHKRVLEGDKGKNTGGMGAYSPSRLINNELEKKIINKIINPTLKGLSEMGSEYKGFLYTGLMIVENEPYLIEYNVRMGDPECQTILPRLKTDLIDIFLACCEKELKEINIEWKNEKSLCVVLCSNGYPDTFKKNIQINNLNSIRLSLDNYMFHAGTIKKDEKILAVGGRVLNFVSLSNDFKIEMFFRMYKIWFLTLPLTFIFLTKYMAIKTVGTPIASNVTHIGLVETKKHPVSVTRQIVEIRSQSLIFEKAYAIFLIWPKILVEPSINTLTFDLFIINYKLYSWLIGQ